MIKSSVVLILILLFANIQSFSQHPRVSGVSAVLGTTSIYEGTLKFNNFGSTVPYIGDPVESRTGDWLLDYEDYHNIPGNVLPGNSEFINFRLLKPKNYDSNPANHDPYPVIVMLHGAGEIGRVWALAGLIYTPDDPEYDNNGRNLIHGAWNHWWAAKEGKHPKRLTAPWTNEYSFDGIVIFPQSHTDNWGTDVLERVVDMLEQLEDPFNIDLNMVYIHGLSNGGVASFNFMGLHPELIAAAAPLSAAGPSDSVANFASIPMFLVNGGLDTNPSTGYMDATISKINTNGGDVIELVDGYPGEVNEDPFYPENEKFNSRHWLIPNDGHGIWQEAYDRRDFFQWFSSKSKKNIFVVGGETTYCTEVNSFTRELRFSAGFKGYQWYIDGEVISGATQWKYTANESNLSGASVKYEVKYSRVDNPDSNNPDHWEISNPLNIIPYQGEAPTIVALSSTHLPSHVGTNNSVVLQVFENAVGYQWYNASGAITGETDKEIEITEQGLYQADIQLQGGCGSDLSDGIFVRTGNDLGAPATPSDFIATLDSESEIKLNWTDIASNETGYEIYSGESSEGPFNLATITPAGTESYIVRNLGLGKNYFFYLRAINTNGASDYVEVIMNTGSDLTPPELPENFQIASVASDNIKISWSEGLDELSGVDYYELYLNGALNGTTNQLEYTFTGLTSNTIYIINLRVKDIAGNYSPMSSQLSAVTSLATSLDYDYYETTGINSVDEIEGQTFVESGTIEYFDITKYDSNPEGDYFAYIFTGYINISTSGTYTFYTSSDDGSKLYIGDELIVNNDFPHGDIEQSGTIDLDVGYYPIKVLFFENGGGNSLSVSYEHSTITKTQIPDNVLFRYDDSSLPLLPAIPTGLDASNFVDDFISLIWNNQSDETGFEVYRSANSGGPYTIIGSTGVDVNTYLDREIISGEVYYYVVKAKNNGGISDPSIEDYNTAPAQTTPAAPIGLTAQIQNEWAEPIIDLTWTSGSTNTRYFIIERSAGDESNYVPIGKVRGDVTSFEDNNLAANLSFFYRIQAENSGGAIYSNVAIQKSTAKRYFVNITRANTSSVAGGVWNNFGFISGGSTPSSIGTQLSGLKDNYDNGSNVSIELFDLFFDDDNTGVMSGDVIFPDNVMLRYHYVRKGDDNLGKLKVNGLEYGTPYKFYFMGSTAQIHSTKFITTYTINGQSVSLNASENEDQLEQLPNIIPNIDGSVTIEITPTGTADINRGLINALIIERGDPTDFQDYYAKSGSDISKLYNWGVYTDGTGGRLKSFNEDNKNLHIVNSGHLYDNLNITGAGTKTIFDSNTIIEVHNEVNTIELSNLEITNNTQVSIVGQGDTCNVKIIQGDLLLGDGSILDIGDNTLTLIPGAALNPENSTGALAFSDGNLIINSQDGSENYLNLVDAEDRIASLTLDLGSGGSLDMNDKLNLTDKLKLHSGQVNTNGNLTLVSDEGIDASILEIESGSIVGNVEYQRYWKRPVGTYGFYYIGSPVLNQTIADWIGEFHIQGIGTSSWKNLNVYDESTSSWVGVGSAAALIEPGKGINSFMFSSNFTDEYIRYDNVGEVEQGDFSYDLSYTGTPNPDPGWNLVANPYPCAIDWSTLDWSGAAPVDVINNVDAAFYIWDQSNGGYIAWTGAIDEDPYIASGQGFFIHTNGSAPVLKLTEGVKVDQKPDFLRESVKENILQIIAIDADSHTDKAYISLMEGATAGFDSHLDALKLNGSYLNLTSILEDGDQLAINALPPGEKAYLIPLNFEAGSGNYSFTFNNLISFDKDYHISFVDTYTDDIIMLDEGLVYEFSIDEDSDSFGNSRFRIEINMNYPEVVVAGHVRDVYARTIGDVSITATSENDNKPNSIISDALGNFELELISQNDYTIESNKKDNYSYEYISLIDYLVFKWYLRGRRTRLSDWEYLAADMDQSGNIDKNDLKLFRKVFRKQFYRRKPQSFNWQFISDNYVLEKNGNTYKLDRGLKILPDNYTDSELELIGLVPGDVYANAQHGLREESSDQDQLVFTLGRPTLKNETYYIPVYGRNFVNISGFQFGFESNVIGIIGEDIQISDEDLSFQSEDNYLVWVAEPDSPLTISDGSLLFYMKIENLEVDEKELNGDIIINESGYGIDGSFQRVGLTIENLSQFEGNGNVYLGSYPNPFNDNFKIKLKIEKAESAQFTFYDANGKLIYSTNIELSVGLYELDLEEDLGFGYILPKGLTIINIQLDNTIITDKLIRN